MLGSLVTSQTRIKLLKKFFLNSNIKAHLRGLESEFCESSNGIRIELNRFEEAGLLKSLRDGNKKIYQVNSKHPLYNDIHSIILKETGIDHVVDKVISRIGNIVSVYLIGKLAHGLDSQLIELILVGDGIDLEYLSRKVLQAQELVGRKIICKIIGSGEEENYLNMFLPSDFFLLWSRSNVEIAVENK